jgi:Rad3-related DNA helicase
MISEPIEFFHKNKIHPRPQQEAALSAIKAGWDDHKYFVLSAPVGVGKTFIATAVADSVNSAYLLTSTLQLQQQYLSSWDELVEIRGRSNYSCNINLNFSVDSAPCLASQDLKAHCIKNAVCSYYNQKAKAIAAKSTLSNPIYLLSSTAHESNKADEDRAWKKRDVFIIDEGHNLEKHLISFCQFQLVPKKLADDLGIDCGSVIFEYNDDMDDQVSKITKILEAAKCRLETLETLRLNDSATKDNAARWAKGFNEKTIEKFKKLNGKIASISNLIGNIELFIETCKDSIGNFNDRWLISIDNSADSKIELCPLYANFLFKKCFGHLSSKFVFLSATIGSKESFCKELGLPLDQTLYIETGTPFQPEKSPIYSFPMLKMGYKDLANTLPKVAPAVADILEAHKNQRGIIHSGTYNLSKELASNLPKEYRDRLIHRDMNVTAKNPYLKLSNESMLKLHETGTTKNSVLMSPSMMEGVDLKDDLSEFQIILKFPWGSLGDKRIKKKSEVDPNWYANAAWLNIMQASGRSTRHQDDESITYILDSSFPYFYSLWKHNLPNWFKDRIIFSKP